MTNHTLLILSARADAYRQLIAAALPDLDIVATTDPDEARAIGAGCALALADPPRLRSILADLPRLQWVQATWAGVETLLGPACRRDYVLTNVRGVFGPAIAEYVFCYALMHERLGWARYAAQTERRWDNTPPGRLRGKVMGLVGVGSIGAHVAATAKHFGMRTLGYTRSSVDCPFIDAYYHGDQLTALAAAADYVVCSLPNTPAGHHLIDAPVLAAMRPHAVLINVGRGTSIDEAALVAALEQGALGGAVLDVFQQEPLPPAHPLWRLPNVIITSHTAALSFAEDIAPIFVENYGRWVTRQPLLHAVDFTRGY